MTVLEASGFVVLVLLPGALFALLFGNSRRDLLIALPLGCGLIYALGNYGSLVGLPIGKGWYLSVVAVLFGGVVWRSDQFPWIRLKFSKTERIALAVSLLIGFLFIAMWWRVAGHLGQLLPNHDAMYHSYVIRNIVETQSTKVGDALRLFPLGTGSAANFYPLGLHSVIALASQICGVSINGAMNVATLVLAIGVFPFSMWVWSRELLEDSNFVAMTAPIAVFLLSSVFPWSPMSWGGMPAIVAMCIAPVVAVVVTDIIYAPSPKGILIAAFSMVGMFSIHATELVLVLLLSFVLMIRRGHIPYRNTVKIGFKIALVSAIALAPVAFATAGGANERNLDYQPVVDVATTVGQSLLFSFPGFVLPFATLLVCFGIVHSNRQRNSVLTWGMGFVVVATSLAAGFSNNSLVQLVTKPWYGQVLRLNYNIVYFATPLLICGISLLLSIKSSATKRIFSISATILIVALGFGQVHRADNLLLESWYDGLVPVNQNSLAAFQWMSKNIGNDEYVLTDYDGIDGSTWMYALVGVRPVMYGAVSDNARDPLREKKIEVLTNIGNLNSRPDLLAFLRMAKIRYIYFDQRTNVISPQHTFSLEQIENDTALTSMFNQFNAHVFEVSS